MLTGVAYTDPTTTTAQTKDIPYEKNVVVKNLYMSNMAEEFIAMQLEQIEGDEGLFELVARYKLLLL